MTSGTPSFGQRRTDHPQARAGLPPGGRDVERGTPRRLQQQAGGVGKRVREL